jgi:hypothetical protein
VVLVASNGIGGGAVAGTGRGSGAGIGTGAGTGAGTVAGACAGTLLFSSLLNICTGTPGLAILKYLIQKNDEDTEGVSGPAALKAVVTTVP